LKIKVYLTKNITRHLLHGSKQDHLDRQIATALMISFRLSLNLNEHSRVLPTCQG